MKAFLLSFVLMLLFLLNPVLAKDVVIGEGILECQPFEYICIDDVLMVCNEYGTGFKIADICNYGCASNVRGVNSVCAIPPPIVYWLLIISVITLLTFFLITRKGRKPWFLSFLRRR